MWHHRYSPSPLRQGFEEKAKKFNEFKNQALTPYDERAKQDGAGDASTLNQFAPPAANNPEPAPAQAEELPDEPTGYYFVPRSAEYTTCVLYVFGCYKTLCFP